jgi:hypothetical protein
MLHKEGRGDFPGLFFSGSNAELNLISVAHKTGEIAVNFGLNPCWCLWPDHDPFWKHASVFQPAQVSAAVRYATGIIQIAVPE